MGNGEKGRSMISLGIREIREIHGEKPGFYALVKNTYLTNRPPTPVSINVYRGFVFQKNLPP